MHCISVGVEELILVGLKTAIFLILQKLIFLS